MQETILPEGVVIPADTIGPETGATNQGWKEQTLLLDSTPVPEPVPAPQTAEQVI